MAREGTQVTQQRKERQREVPETGQKQERGTRRGVSHNSCLYIFMLEFMKMAYQWRFELVPSTASTQYELRNQWPVAVSGVC